MRTSLFSLLGFSGCLLLSSACQQDKQVSACTYAHQVTIDSECYTGNGLRLTATDYGNTPDGFEWNVIALKDTSESWGWTPKDEKIIMTGLDTFTIPDSLVSNYEGLIIKVATNCQGQLKHSKYYGLTKTSSTTGNCTIWRVRTN
ncbi:hypothetical protein [Spirosoma oryzicola]|uniref:hypothetical protein n=1 Tax=Spirosoma oryzicola TaxID=2898794 RepID=UPI001E5805AB|nr:hypothetical protein [Spirosoma oryzicola]UHG94061.1 hypothetical protein LQ777_26185 [Spirosoma oryzicola]